MDTEQGMETSSTTGSRNANEWKNRLGWLGAAVLLALITLLLAPTNHIRPVRVTPPKFVTRKPISPTLLDEVGNLEKRLSPSQAGAWRAELASGKADPSRAALLHDWIGEYLLSQEQNPDSALVEFQAAQKLVGKTDPAYGLAAYNEALAVFSQGAYQAAAAKFYALITTHDRLRGYDFNNARLWYRHAGACAGYHQVRAALGIPEPPKLDPLCGAAAMAACLRGRGLPYSRDLVLKAVPVTGRGSTFAGVLNSGKKLGVVTRSVALDDEGLKSVPLPIVAYVEHDHFIAVVAANEKGVSYLCSDCGPFPGGQVNLTWKQWQMLDATNYIAVTRKESPSDRWLAAVLQPRSHGAAVHRTARTKLKRTWTLADLGMKVPAPTAMGRHIVAGFSAPTQCGYSPGSLHCGCPVPCPSDAIGGGPGWGSGGSSSFTVAGPSVGDPVNLATGEEEYTPGADLSVYNPIGPSVSWSRIYNSMRGYDLAYQVDDYGYGWSQNYNISVYDPGVIPINRVPVGIASIGLAPTGSDSPAGGQAWDIVYNGSVIASAGSPAGWGLTLGGVDASVTPPISATQGFLYELRYTIGATNYSLYMDVLPAPSVAQIPQNNFRSFAATGTDAPASGLLWDIQLSGVTVATSANNNGWSVSSIFTVFAPLSAQVGTYEVRYAVIGCGYTAKSAFFQVYIPDALPGTGTKYLVFPNGARVQFIAPSIPTASSPVVTCSVAAGYPYLVQWHYTLGGCGYYVITDSSRTQYVTTNYSFAGQKYYLGQQIDRNGNYINFSYTAGTSGEPVLSAISDSAGAALLTIQRATDGTDNITSISDRYGRSVYYHCSSYANTGVDAGWPTAWQELDGVSQIVTTGTSSPPARYALGYTPVSNGGEGIVTLTSITVPSPTGAGTSTATINYKTDGTGFVASLVDANGNHRIYSYLTGTSTQVTVTNSVGAVAYTYTSSFDMNMSTISRTDGTNSTLLFVNTYADPDDPYRPSSTEDALGNVTSHTWDQFGNMLTETTPRGTTTTNTVVYTNFALGELTQTQAGSQTPTTFTYYEPSGLIQTLSAPQPGTAGSGATVTASRTYDSVGNLLTTVSPGNGTVSSVTTTYGYTTDGSYTQPEALGQAITITDNIGNTTHLRYNARGTVASATDPLGNTIYASYNIADQTTQTTVPATGQTGSGSGYAIATYQYPGGPLSYSTLYNESSTSIRQVNYAYGFEGETLAVTGSTEPSSRAYDAAYRTASLTDGNSHTTTYSFNTAGYIAQISYPGGDTLQYTSYNAAGSPLTRVDGRGTTTTYVYSDPEAKLTGVSYSDGTPSVSLSYDSFGRTESVTDGSGSTGFVYDDGSRPLSVTTTYTGLPSIPVSYGYNNDGSRASLGTPGGSFSYAYDGDGRASSLTNPFSEGTSYSYLNNNWLWKRQMYNSSGTLLGGPIYSYNALGQATDLSNKNASGSILSDFGSISHDGQGNRVSVTANIPGAPSAYSGVTGYSYDTKNELTQETSTRNGGYTNNFGFDGAGNPTSYIGATQTFNNDNQRTGTGLAYDSNGNPTSYFGTTLTYDAENRVTQIGSALTNGYRADGLRAWKLPSGGSKTYFIYDGLTPVCEVNSSGTATATNTWGPDGLISRHTSSGSVFYTFDPQGNTVQRLNSSGSILNSNMYSAQGVSVTTASNTDPYSGFGAQWGYYTDVETGLQLLGHRFYDSGTGRFINRDPIGYSGGINLYNYGGANPVSNIDPSGHILNLNRGGNWCIIRTVIQAIVSGVGFMHGGYLQGADLSLAEVEKCLEPGDQETGGDSNSTGSAGGGSGDGAGGDGPPNPNPPGESGPPTTCSSGLPDADPAVGPPQTAPLEPVEEIGTAEEGAGGAVATIATGGYVLAKGAVVILSYRNKVDSYMGDDPNKDGIP